MAGGHVEGKGSRNLRHGSDRCELCFGHACFSAEQKYSRSALGRQPHQIKHKISARYPLAQLLTG